ncbi:MAG: 50S ribosomal protein L22 [Candidatus Saccharimonadales bacterium]
MRAVAKGIRVSPRKIGVVAALIRSRDVADALVILENTPRGAAKELSDIIKSAAANAEHNDKLDINQLKIADINVNTGGMMKRYRPHGRLSVRPQRHRLSNVIVQLEKKEV